MCLNFQVEFPTRCKSFGVTIIAPLERAGKNLSIYVFCFFPRDFAYDYERVKQSVCYAKKFAARACWSVLARLCRGSSSADSVSELPRASGGCTAVPPLSDSPRSAAIRGTDRALYTVLFERRRLSLSCVSRITVYRFPHSVSTQRSACIPMYMCSSV